MPSPASDELSAALDEASRIFRPLSPWHHRVLFVVAALALVAAIAVDPYYAIMAVGGTLVAGLRWHDVVLSEHRAHEWAAMKRLYG